MANTVLQQLVAALTHRGSVYDDKGTLVPEWQLFLQGVISDTANSGSSGNTTVTTDFGTAGFNTAFAQQIEDLNQKILYLLRNPALAIALQAVQTQQANNAVNSAGDVLDLIRLSEAGIILSSTNMYLAALPDSSANLDFYVASNDFNDGFANANTNIGSSNSNVEIVLMGPPDGLYVTGMDIQFLTISNNDASLNCNLQFYLSVDGTAVPLMSNIYLQHGYTFVFDENGYRVLDETGTPLRH
jgi:hypothetical protein